MRRLPLTALLPIAMIIMGSGFGCAGNTAGRTSSPPVPEASWKAGPPPSSVEHPEWEHDYWDMYGLVSEGSMWNPEAFLALDDDPDPELARVQLEIEVQEAVEPTTQAPSPEDQAIFIEPTLSAACGLTEPDVRFAVDSAQVPRDETQLLDQLAECLTDFPLEDDPLAITGHADPRGPEEYNRELGLDRADEVAAALVERGIEAERIDTYSRGELLASDDPEAWPADRRVLIELQR